MITIHHITIRHSHICYILLALLTLTTLPLRAQPELPGTPQAAQPPLTVIVPKDEHPDLEHIQYFYKLLHLALNKTIAEDGPYQIQEYPEATNYERYLQNVENGTVDVLWTNSDKNREEKLRAVPVSILKDLNSYRIFFIRREDQPKFHRVKNLEDLRKLTAGQGTTWPDTEILKNNDIRVVTAMRQDSLIKMLSSERFDFYPRGLYEIWREEQALTVSSIVIEDSLMIHYHSPIYFFVNKKNQRLATRLERGLNLAIADGSFDKLFLSVANFKRGYEEQLSGKRRIISLKN